MIHHRLRLFPRRFAPRQRDSAPHDPRRRSWILLTPSGAGAGSLRPCPVAIAGHSRRPTRPGPVILARRPTKSDRWCLRAGRRLGHDAESSSNSNFSSSPPSVADRACFRGCLRSPVGQAAPRGRGSPNQPRFLDRPGHASRSRGFRGHRQRAFWSETTVLRGGPLPTRGITGICGSCNPRGDSPSLFLAGVFTHDGIVDGRALRVVSGRPPDGRRFSYPRPRRLGHPAAAGSRFTQNDVRAIQPLPGGLVRPPACACLMDHAVMTRRRDKENPALAPAARSASPEIDPVSTRMVSPRLIRMPPWTTSRPRRQCGRDVALIALLISVGAAEDRKKNVVRRVEKIETLGRVEPRVPGACSVEADGTSPPPDGAPPNPHPQPGHGAAAIRGAGPGRWVHGPDGVGRLTDGPGRIGRE